MIINTYQSLGRHVHFSFFFYQERHVFPFLFNSILPTAVVIPVPIAYIKVVAAEELVVRFLAEVFTSLTFDFFGRLGRDICLLEILPNFFEVLGVIRAFSEMFHFQIPKVAN